MVAKRIKLDFSKVEERSGWNTNLMPEGLHEFKITDVNDAEAPDGTDMYVFALKPTASRFAARNFPYYCKLQANQYWKLRDLLIAAGIPVPKKVGNVDPNKAIGKLIACEVTDATGKYEGRSEINGVYGLDVLDGDSGPAGDDDSEDDEEYDDEAEGDDEVEDDEDEVEDDEEGEEGDDELAEELEGLTLVELRKRAKGLGLATTGLKKDDLIDLIIEEETADEDDEDEDELDDDDLDDEELEDEEFEDDEDEEEEPPAKPARRAAPARKPAAKAAPAASTRRVKRR